MEAEEQRLLAIGAKYALAQRAKSLRELPIESLKSLTKGRVRWSALRAGGVDTVADAHCRSVSQLERLDGVGPFTASAVRDATHTVVGRVIAERVKPPRSTHNSGPS